MRVARDLPKWFAVFAAGELCGIFRWTEPCTPWLAALSWTLMLIGAEGIRRSAANHKIGGAARWVLCLLALNIVAVQTVRLPAWLGVQTATIAAAFVTDIMLQCAFVVLLFRAASLYKTINRHAAASCWRWAAGTRLLLRVVLGTGLLGYLLTLRNSQGSNLHFSLGRGDEWILLAALAVMGLPVVFVFRAVSRSKRTVALRADICAVCGYSRIGLVTMTCPECGAVASVPLPDDATPVSKRVSLGRFGLAAAMAVCAVLAAGWWADSNTGPLQVRPMWMLLRDAHMRAQVRSLAPLSYQPATIVLQDPDEWVNPPSAIRAQRELLRRARSGALSGTSAEDLISACLAVQRDSTQPIGEWGAVFEAAYAARLVKASDVEAFISNSWHFEIVTRTEYAAGEPLVFHLLGVWRGAQLGAGSLPTYRSFRAYWGWKWERLMVDGHDIAALPGPDSFVPMTMRPDETMEFRFTGEVAEWRLPTVNLAPGEHRVQLQMSYQEPDDLDVRLRAASLTAGRIDFQARGTLRVVDRETRIPRATDASLRNSLSGISASLDFRLRRQKIAASLALRLAHYQGTPTPVALGVYLASGQSEFMIGTIGFVPDAGSSWSGHLEVPSEFVDALYAARNEPIILVLRSSASSARSLVGDFHVLPGGEIRVGSPVRIHDRTMPPGRQPSPP